MCRILYISKHTTKDFPIKYCEYSFGIKMITKFSMLACSQGAFQCLFELQVQEHLQRNQQWWYKIYVANVNV